MKSDNNQTIDAVDIHQAIAKKGIFNIRGVSIPDDASSQDWAEIHRTIIMCCYAAAKWKKQSRDFASSKWDIDFAADTEVQIEMDLGIEFPEDKPRLNPADKSVGIVTIEATNASFIAWERKMHDEIPTWDSVRLQKALDLLEPMERKASEIRQLLQSK